MPRQTPTDSLIPASSATLVLAKRLSALAAAFLCGGAAVYGVGHATGVVRSQLLPRGSESGAAPATADPLAVAAAARAVSGRAFAPNYVETATNLRHWDKRIITVNVAHSDRDNKTETQVRRLVVRALGMWNAKIGEAVLLQLTDSRDADINVSFVAPKSLAGGAIGRTDVTFRLSDQVLTHANVRLNTGLSADEFLQVCAHEIGHALGIQGHSADPRDLMYTYAHVPAVITDRDLNTMSISYAAALRSRPNANVASATRTDDAENVPAFEVETGR